MESERTFRLVAVMRPGSAPLAEIWPDYPTIEAARAGGRDLLQDARVLRVMIVVNTLERQYPEWTDR